MIPYGHQNIDQEDIREVITALKSDWLTQGPRVLQFEKALAKYCGAKYAVAVSSGTAALHLAYLAAGLKEGDEVITTPNTFVATTNMLLAVGAKPVFCDIRLDTYNFDETKIEKLITKRTKAIAPVHFGGQPCALAEIQRIAKKHKLLVIEDACHALGASYKNKKIGGLSDMSVFSFHPVKSITTGEGGAVLTNNKKFYDQLILLRSHGIHKDENGANVMTGLGYNYRITDFQAALGLSQLKKLDKFMKQRRQIVRWYRRYLRDEKSIILPLELADCLSSWHLYVIRTKNKADRPLLRQYLLKHGVGVNFHYPAVYSQPYYQNHGYRGLKLPAEEVYHSSCITLPCFPRLKEPEIKFICKNIKEYFSK
ncbi:MAG: UDP-4-keto-6-deoxy-N-acetylglucosamine 4-aminotransferase [Parcubacteria group bacterium GW2011_GWC2_42_12]|nr:MAG: UDP-4-keto-6-deoxy-N-acetylglucosamine 4-aminotransferase [Parcubacteria group bacterium GW2011_GWC2_42_12]